MDKNGLNNEIEIIHLTHLSPNKVHRKKKDNRCKNIRKKYVVNSAVSRKVLSAANSDR